MDEHVTILHADARESAARGISSGLPTDLVSQSANRLRVLALLYAFVFFMAGVLPAPLPTRGRGPLLSGLAPWGPAGLPLPGAPLGGLVRPSPPPPPLTASD